MCNDTPTTTPAVLFDAVLATTKAEYGLLQGAARDATTDGHRTLFLGATVNAVIAFHTNPRDPRAVAAMSAEMAKTGEPMWRYAEKALLEHAPRRGVRLATVTTGDLTNLSQAVAVRKGHTLADSAKNATVARDARALLAHADTEPVGPSKADLQASDDAWALERLARPAAALADAQAQANEAARKRRTL